MNKNDKKLENWHEGKRNTVEVGMRMLISMSESEHCRS